MKWNRSVLLVKFLELPAIFHYVGFGVLALLLIGYVFSGSNEEPVQAWGETNSPPRAIQSFPQPLSPRVDMLSQLQNSSGVEGKTKQKLNEFVAKLQIEIGKLIKAPVAGTVTPVSWIAPEFSGNGIDRDKFQVNFSGQEVVVRRWRKTETSVQIAGENSFEQFIRRNMNPWLGAFDFRIDLKVYKTKIADGMIDASVVAETFGRTEIVPGLQATSIWNTRWRIEGESLSLESIQIQAQEEALTSVAGGQMMLDCTASILQRCDSLNTQLAYGLDQWSRRIPGIDIVGNHGVAVGDINSDGLDDIYVCQPHGLPNLLLVQNPDGTVDDLSKISNLDLLDESHAALIVDIDNDHDQDLVITTDENLLLLSNKGDGEFQLEHRLAIGRNGQSVSAADFDQDGDLDLFICKYQEINRQNDLLMFPANLTSANDGGRNVLLRNDEGWNFKDVTEESGITSDNNFYSRSAVWVDHDYDGDLDLYVVNEFAADQFFENQEGWFSDISDELGLKNTARHRSVSIGEFNRDGRPDFFVATDASLTAIQELDGLKSDPDFGGANLAKSFSDQNLIWFSAEPQEEFIPYYLRAPIFSSDSAFSSATADLNNDGMDDLIVTNGFLTRYVETEVDSLFYQNAFLNHQQSASVVAANDATRNDTYTSSSNAVGAEVELPDSTLTFGTYAARVKEVDIVKSVALTAHQISDLCRSGYSFGSNQRNRCYLGTERGFANFSAASGLDLPEDARAIATTDWDNDGDADLIMTCRSGPQLRIFCNQSKSDNSFVQFDLVGTESNTDAIGARVELFVPGSKSPLIRFVQAGSGNLSQSSKRLMFGLGQVKTIVKAVVTWPTGKSVTFDNLNVNTRYEIVEGMKSVAEKSNDRFNLSIRPKNFGSKSLPDVLSRSIFYPRPPLPNLEYMSAPQDWTTLIGKNKKPMVALFCSRSAASRLMLQNFSDDSQKFKAIDIDCAAVFIDPDYRSEQDEEKLERTYSIAKEAVAESEFPFRWGAAAASTIEKLEYLSGDWFNNQQLPPLPFAMLIDKDGSVCGFYSEEASETYKILKDVGMLDQPDWSCRTAAAPIGGRWTARYRYPKLNRLRTRFKEIGYEKDAELIGSRSAGQRAYELAQKAIELDSQGETNRSKNFFQQALSVDPKCIAAYVGQGELLRRMAADVAGTDSEIALKYQQQASSDFEQAISLDPMNTDAILGRANIAIDQNRIEDALGQLKEYIEVDPERYEVYAVIGRLLFFQQKYKQAAAVLGKAFENRPTLPFVAGDLGYIYLSTGDYAEAKKFLSLANRLQPSDRNLLRLLAEAEFVNGEFQDAIELLKRVNNEDPNRRRSRNMLSWLLATSPYEKSRDAEEAMELIKPMVDLFGETSPSTLEIYAACFAEQGEFEQAVEFQKKAVDLVSADETVEGYTVTQKEGLQSRLELYKRQRPYRMEDIDQIPIRPPGR
ncbi:MAG: FG-GAP-like repeat-containing protein [Mariniblastus sp.]